MNYMSIKFKNKYKVVYNLYEYKSTFMCIEKINKKI